MKDIFLSYKKQDADRVRILVEALEREGYSIWWDRTIPPGSSWAEVIEEAITSCRVVVVVWSKLSAGSEWVNKEARKGEMRRILVPVVIDETEIPFEFEHVQGANLIGWDGVSPNEQFEMLKREIAAIIEAAPDAEGTAAAREERARVKAVSRGRLMIKRMAAGAALLASAAALGLYLLAPATSASIRLNDLKLEGVRFSLAAAGLEPNQADLALSAGASTSVLVLDDVPIADLVAFGLIEVRIPASSESTPRSYTGDPLVSLEAQGEGSWIALNGLELSAGSRIELQKTDEGVQLAMRGVEKELHIDVAGSILVAVEDEELLDFEVPGRVGMRPDASGVTLEFSASADQVTLFENVAIDTLKFYRVDQNVDLERTDISLVSTILSGEISADWMSEPRKLGQGEGLLLDSFNGELERLELVGDTITLNAHGTVAGMRRGLSRDGESLMPTRYAGLVGANKLLVTLGVAIYLGGLAFLNLRLWRRKI